MKPLSKKEKRQMNFVFGRWPRFAAEPTHISRQIERYRRWLIKTSG